MKLTIVSLKKFTGNMEANADTTGVLFVYYINCR